MPINPFDDELIDADDVRKLTPFKTKPCKHTVWRWFTRGIRGVKLESLKIGPKYYTTREAFERFVREQSERPNTGGPPKGVLPKCVKRRQAAAKKRLASMGI